MLGTKRGSAANRWRRRKEGPLPSSLCGPKRNDRRGSAGSRRDLLTHGLVILLFDVYSPDVVFGSRHDVLDGEHRCVHRMVLVVVLMHAVAPDWMKVRCGNGHPAPDVLHGLGIPFVIDGVRLWHTHHIAAL